MDGFQQTLDRIRSIAETEARKGRIFERLMKTYFSKDPLYSERFTQVWLWPEWATGQPHFDGTDIGIDLVAAERQGGVCAIQCKCYAPGTRISKVHLDSFIAASARDPFTSRIVVDTGAEWGPNATKTIDRLKPACAVLRFADLARRPFDWPDLASAEPEALALRAEAYSLRPHQREALEAVVEGLRAHDRGKLIMACGTGKTFTALHIAEEIAGNGGRTLYLVPSISLFVQSMREWATHRALPHRYIGICSDTRAGRNDEDASLQELELPVTTDPAAISAALREPKGEALTVVFCTYHSLGLVERAQAEGAPAFDLALCDEAHRTTGVERPGDKTSPFVLVHDAGRIRARKRLYMTATPRLYTAGAKTKAARHEAEVFSMDDLETYGPEFHRLPFSRAVEQDLLADYKVVVFAMSEQRVDAALQAHLATGDSELNLTDAAKIVGCWRALQNPENRPVGNSPAPRLVRAIAFTNTILASRRLATHWERIVNSAIGMLPAGEQPGALRCETRHVDGQHHALERKARLEWLEGEAAGGCRILSNARCLTEGIDVPALDAVLFMSPRSSAVDIVQGVGRAMRKAPGKDYGYIVLPIAVPAGLDPAAALNDNERFAVVWNVLRALRSHDDRFDAEINRIDLNQRPTERIILSADGEGDGALPGTAQLALPPLDLPPDALFAKVVEKCGDRKYWETWAKDVAEIFARLVSRIESLLEHAGNETLRAWFGAFHKELRESINAAITRAHAIDMMAQHILTRPVFEALFEGYDFAASNPVARALDALRKDFAEFGLANETRDLERFYESVRMRARGLDNSAARQRVLMELYEKFFATALKKDADRLGIVYTPTEVVDFILLSADEVLRSEFGRRLSDENVHVLDPFTGTGIFLVRLLQSDLIRPADLERKYRHELHANEIVLLAYYIAAVHIEEAFRGRRGLGCGYESFAGIVLTDTFNLHTGRSGFPREWLPDNSVRVERQQTTPIQVIVGNPPWSTGQRSSAENNPNVDYPEIELRVADTYAARSNATLKNSLYDTYKMAIRWASDRIGDEGVVAFVTNGSWIDGNADAGVRACLAEEFNSIHVLNLRGNQRTQGERSRREGGKIFGQGSRAPVAITILVRKKERPEGGCRILYRDIGDYLKREEKLDILREAGSMRGIQDWKQITPDGHHDWIGQRSESFQVLYPVGSKAVKSGRSDNAVFELFSRGYATSRDAYLYNFSHDACAENARKAVDDYMGAMNASIQHPDLGTDEVVQEHSRYIRWDRELKNNMRRGNRANYQPSNVTKIQYRPFVKQYCYVEYVLINNKYQMDRIFPKTMEKNYAICVSGIGSTKPFSALLVNHAPDLHLISFGQCFPRYRFRSLRTNQPKLLESESSLDRIDNITNDALIKFRMHYVEDSISKDDIFYYVYGILNSPLYKKRFSNDLSKGLPRIPLVRDLKTFSLVRGRGGQLAKRHLDYESCAEYPLSVERNELNERDNRGSFVGKRAMSFVNPDKTSLRINESITLHGIPESAHQYQVNGRTPLEWFIDRYKISTDRESGITNDPNAWFTDLEDFLTAIRRIVYVSVESTRIIEGLPDPFDT